MNENHISIDIENIRDEPNETEVPITLLSDSRNSSDSNILYSNSSSNRRVKFSLELTLKKMRKYYV